MFFRFVLLAYHHTEMNPQRKGLVKSAAIIHEHESSPFSEFRFSEGFCY